MHGVEDEGPPEKQAEAGLPPVDRESGASHQGTPSPSHTSPADAGWGNEASVPNTQDLASCAVGAAQVGRLPADSEPLADSWQLGREFPNPPTRVQPAAWSFCGGAATTRSGWSTRWR